MQWPTLQGIPINNVSNATNQGNPNNPGAAVLPRGNHPTFRPATAPPPPRFPTQFSISHEADGDYLIPGNSGSGITYLNPSGQNPTGTPFITVPHGRFDSSRFQVAPIKQPTFPIFHFLSRL